MRQIADQSKSPKKIKSFHDLVTLWVSDVITRPKTGESQKSN